MEWYNPESHLQPASVNSPLRRHASVLPATADWADSNLRRRVDEYSNAGRATRPVISVGAGGGRPTGLGGARGRAGRGGKGGEGSMGSFEPTSVCIIQIAHTESRYRTQSRPTLSLSDGRQITAAAPHNDRCNYHIVCITPNSKRPSDSEHNWIHTGLHRGPRRPERRVVVRGLSR